MVVGRLFLLARRSVAVVSSFAHALRQCQHMAVHLAMASLHNFAIPNHAALLLVSNVSTGRVSTRVLMLVRVFAPLDLKDQIAIQVTAASAFARLA